jgi:hypothetical protein
MHDLELWHELIAHISCNAGRVIVHYMTNRCISAFGAVVFAVAGLTACGGGSDEVVARVAGVGSISKATLEHWMPIEAVLIYQEFPTRPIPKGVIPDPPDFTGCIAYLKSLSLKSGEAKSTVAQLKTRCTQRVNELRVITLNALLGWYWTIGAGMALGMKASDAEIRQRLKEVNGRFFPTKGSFARYLKLTRETVPDMLFRSKVQVFEVKIGHEQAAAMKRLPKGLTVAQRQSALAKLTENSAPKRWAARTSCREGYVVSGCKEYRGSLAPGLPN